MTQQERILKLAQEKIPYFRTNGAKQWGEALPEALPEAVMVIIKFTLENLWISVNDELPKVEDRPFSERVLILCKNGAVTRACYIKENNSWFCSDAGFGVGDTDVTHWMPFPKPQEGGAR